MSRLAAAGVFLLCAAVAGYCIFLIVVGAAYTGCTESLPPSPNDGCRTEFVPVSIAVVPLGLTLLVAAALAIRRTAVALFMTLPLAFVGLVSGFSIGGPIFVAAFLMIVLLAIRYAALPRGNA